MNRKTEITGHFLAFVTIFIWGTTFISTKLLLKTLSPIEILFLRFTLGLLLLLAVYPHRLRVREKKHELYFAAAGLCGITLYYLLENIALTYTLTSNVGVIISIAPFFTAIFAHLLLDGEKLRLQFFIGFGIAVIGIFLIWAAYSVLTRKISRFQYNTIQVTRRTFFYGLIFMIPALFIFGFEPDLQKLMQPTNVFNLLFLGLGASALCFVTWNSAVKLLGAVKTSVYIYMVPVITVVTSVLVLKETITGMLGIGVLLTLAGLLISEYKAPAAQKEFN